MTDEYLRSAQHFVRFGKLFGISFFDLAARGGDDRRRELLYCVPFFVCFAYVCDRAFGELAARDVAARGASEISTAALKMILTQHAASQILKAAYFWHRRAAFKSAFVGVQNVWYSYVQALGASLQQQRATEGARVAGHLCAAVVLNVYVESFARPSAWIVVAHHLFNFVGCAEIALMYKLLGELSRQCGGINDRLRARIGCLAAVGRRAKGGAVWNVVLDVERVRRAEKDAFFDGARDMADAHLTIGRIARDVNAVFAASCLLGVLGDFTMLTCTTVSFCQDIRQLLNVGAVHFVIMLKAFNDALHVALILIKQCYSIYYWTKLKDALKETITCLHKMWNTLARLNEIDEQSNYLQLLIVQLFNGIPNFSAFGIVVLDWPLILYVISSAATYVVIIMQFDLASKTSPTVLGNLTTASPLE